jgi:hypothetical protein
MLAAALHQLPAQILVACSIVPLFYTMKSHCRWRYGCDSIGVRLVYLSLLVSDIPCVFADIGVWSFPQKFGAGDNVLLGLSGATRALTHILPVCMSSFVD